MRSLQFREDRIRATFARQSQHVATRWLPNAGCVPADSGRPIAGKVDRLRIPDVLAVVSPSPQPCRGGRGDTQLRAYAGAVPHPPPPSGRTTYRNDCFLIETWAPHDTAMARRVCPRQLRRVCPGHHTVCPRRHNPPSPVSTSPSTNSPRRTDSQPG